MKDRNETATPSFSDERSRLSSTASSDFWKYMKEQYRLDRRQNRHNGVSSLPRNPEVVHQATGRRTENTRNRSSAPYGTETQPQTTASDTNPRSYEHPPRAQAQSRNFEKNKKQPKNPRQEKRPGKRAQPGNEPSEARWYDDSEYAEAQYHGPPNNQIPGGVNQQYYYYYGYQPGQPPPAQENGGPHWGYQPPNRHQAMYNHAQQRAANAQTNNGYTAPRGYQSPASFANQSAQYGQPAQGNGYYQQQQWGPRSNGYRQPHQQYQNGAHYNHRDYPSSANLSGFGHGQYYDPRPLEQRLYDDIYEQHQLVFPPNWALPPPGRMPPAYRYIDAEKAITRGLIKPFQGTIDDYRRFQQSFYSLIHIQPGPIFHKILALDKLLVDENTMDLMKGLGMTGIDYVTRIQRLEQEYGGPDRFREHHLRHLRHLDSVLDGKLSTLKSYTKAIETYLLNSAPEEIHNPLLGQLVKGRMTHQLKVEYNAYKNAAYLPDDNQTLAWFLHFKTTNEANALEDTDYLNQKNRGVPKKFTKPAEKTTKTANQVHEAEDHESEDVHHITAGPAKKRVDVRKKPAEKQQTDTSKQTCVCCNNTGHVIQNCEQFYEKTPTERRTFAADKGICYICLLDTHISKDCPKKEYKKCGICKGRHHFLLHPTSKVMQKQAHDVCDDSDEEESVTEISDSDTSYISCAYQQARKPKKTETQTKLDIAISYCTVWIRNPGNDKRVKINLLADTGANNCSLDNEVAKELGIQGPREPYYVQVGGGRLNAYSAFPATLAIKGTHPGAEEHTVQFQVYKRPCGNLAPINWAEHKRQWTHLAALDLPEAAEKPVQGLVGMLEPWLIAATQPAITGGRHEPTATMTRLGWIVGGRVRPQGENRTNYHVTFMNDQYEETKKNLERFWGTESITLSDDKDVSKRQTEEEKAAVAIFNDTIQRLPNGQYQVGLLWKNHLPLPYNYRQALNMFYGLERLMARQPQMRENFNATIKEWLNKDIVQYVPTNSKSIRYILPTFMVVRHDKATTAYRLVVDGARRFSGICINDRLLPGPSLIHHIFDILCRMRIGKYAMTCDVQSMYLNVKVKPNDRGYLCMFFRESEGLPMKVVQFTSHPFGLTSSPYVAMRAVERHAELVKTKYPLAYQAVKTSVIVDDFIVADDDPNRLTSTLSQLQNMLQDIGMGVHKIASNSTAVLQTVEPDKIAKSTLITEPGDNGDLALPTVKALGIIWNAPDDTFTVGFQPQYLDESLTLRKVVSDGGKLYDPLGLVLPVTMGGRILQQACWMLGEGWDKTLPEDLQHRWKKWATKARTLQEFQVPRGIKAMDRQHCKQRLITFVDASAEAQAVVTYVQTLYQDGTLTSHLLASKGKVSSIRKQESIPRLECAAAAMGAAFTRTLEETLHWEPRTAVLFSDSMTTLWWIKSNKPLKVYVANRICTILDSSTSTQWRHVATDQNPADLPTRTMSVAKLNASTMWRHGPEFLKTREADWPKQPEIYSTPESNAEERSWDSILDKVHTMVELPEYSAIGSELRKIWGRYSNPSKGLNVTSYVHQAYWFWNNRKEQDVKRPKTEINLEELRRKCLTTMIRQEQERHLNQVRAALQAKKSVEARYAPWRPFIDEEGVVRINGRASHLPTLSINHRYQILMTKAMPLAEELVRLTHEERLRHCGGPQQLLATVRERTWIENGMVLAKRVIKNCAMCQRRNAREIEHQTGPLHANRHQGSRPFGSIGVDMFGPLEVSRGRGKSRGKRYGIIFACTITRAINVEIADDASAKSCLLAFRRHAAMYGQPQIVNSDRGTNFQHVRTTMKDIETAWLDAQPSIRQHFPEITWTLNPPRTPSFGGHYEALVKTIKTTFKTLIKWPRITLNDEELRTCLKEAAAIANMRPLTELSDSPTDELPLKPSDFLTSPLLGSTPDDAGILLSGKLKTQVETIRQELWQRMISEVLQTTHKPRRGEQGKALQPGDLVLLKTPNWRPDYWPLARVVDTKPGIDNETRVVTVRHLYRGDAKDQVKETLQSTKNVYRIKPVADMTEDRLVRDESPQKTTVRTL